MTTLTFADRYAEAGLSPSPEVITSRQGSVKRIVENITDNHILDLVCFYYGSTNINLDWFRDEFVKDDASFSLVNKEREARVLSASVLGELIDDENAVAILAVCVGSAKGLRLPLQSTWLLVHAEECLMRLAVEERAFEEIPLKIAPTITAKLDEEITALGSTNDWATLITLLGKIRTEAQTSARTTATQSISILKKFERQKALMREESQMLWWLTGGYSRTFNRNFTTFSPQQAAIVGAVDLGDLTSSSRLGPVAIPAMLERVILSAKKGRGAQPKELAAAIDGFTVEELESLNVSSRLPARLAPISTAIELARTIGVGAWHQQFQARTGFESSIQLELNPLAEQLYREHLLGQLL
ncbi:GTPase-associated system all-helical protein GASH [Lelliottia wanjuensis]|uniref:GTPase-associated system all-helical protein GASH n=1 Tax=Lelliottia wanjuensis TaxID=3050585 RepID=UPI00254D9755|nr:GTPase-associated system all-helical protein GASH [Lelliottia sp. V86_10]MDK9585741.1 GTPase-associated system all-helical protein GASH [Lelliottia sp. V86_10]